MDAGVWMEVREVKKKYSTWYRSCSDTKINNKKKNTYLCKDQIPLAMTLGCVCQYMCVCVRARAHIGHMFTLI